MKKSKSESAFIKILFVVQNSRNIVPLINYLTRRGLRVWVATNQQEALEKNDAISFDAVIISWNLRQGRVMSLYDAFKARGVPSVIFTEDSSRKTEFALAQLQGPKIMFPPNTGSRCVAALEKLLDRQLNLQKGVGPHQKGETYRLPDTATSCQPDDITQNGRWVRVDDDTVPPYVYRLIPPRNTHPGKFVHYCRGKTPPVPNLINNTWSSSDPESKFFRDPIKVREVTLTEAEDFDPSRRAVYTLDSNPKKPVARDIKDSEFHPELNRIHMEPKNDLEHSIREAARIFATNPTPASNLIKLGESFQYSALILKSKSYEGYLITAVGEDPILDLTIFSEFHTYLKQEMAEKGEIFEDISSPMMFKTNPLTFLPWARENSRYIITSQYQDLELIYAYVPAPISQLLVTPAFGNMPAIPVNALIPGVEVPIDLFLSLPKNQKFLHYFRKGMVLEQKHLDKLADFKVNFLHYQPQDKSAYLAYIAAGMMSLPEQNKKKKAG